MAELSKAFMLADGRKLLTIKELADAIPTLDEKTFRAHVSDEHNDFADWIEGAFDDPMFANELRTASNNIELHQMLDKKAEELRAAQDPKAALPQTARPPEASSIQFISPALGEATPPQLPAAQSGGSAESDVTPPGQGASTEADDGIETVIPTGPIYQEENEAKAIDLMAEYHEVEAPTIENEEQGSADIEVGGQEVEASAIVQETLTVDDPSKAPIIDMGGNESSDNGEALMPSSAEAESLSADPITQELAKPQTIVLPAVQGTTQQERDDSLMMRMMMLYQYLIMLLTGKGKPSDPQET